MSNVRLIPELVRVLEKHLDQGHYLRVVMIPAGAPGLLAAFGFTLDSPSLRVAAAIFLPIYMGILLVAVDVRRRQAVTRLRSIERDLGTAESRAERYAKAIVSAHRSDPNMFSIKSWKETMTVSAAGDTVIVRDLILITGMRGLELTASALSANEAAQGPVTFTSHWLESDGTEGVTIPSTFTWEDSGKRMRVFLHYTEVVDAGQELRLRLRWEWSGYCRLLVSGHSEPMSFTLSHRCDRLEYRLVLESSCQINRLKSRALNGSRRPQVKSSPDKTHTLLFKSGPMDPGQKVGFEVDPR